MSVVIRISAEAEKRLHELAHRAGQSVEDFAGRLLEKQLFGANGDSPFRPPAGGKTFAEILAPVHADFRESGMTEGELDALLRDALDETRAGRKDGRDTAS